MTFLAYVLEALGSSEFLLYSDRKSGLVRNAACFGFRREAFSTVETVNMSLCLSSTALEGSGHLNASARLPL